MATRSLERQLWRRLAVVTLPGLLVVTLLVLSDEDASRARWLIPLIVLGCSALAALWVMSGVRYPLRTLSNQIAAMREGDYSLRVRGASAGDSLGELVRELNGLGEFLRRSRLEGMEKAALLRTVMREINVAIFTFTEDQRLQLVNRAGEELLGRPVEQLLGKTAADIGLDDCLEGEGVSLVDRGFGGRMGRWEIRRSSFREEGQPHQLVVIADLSRALREEERVAWKRLIRVMGHEINNSLAPIKSITGSLERILARDPRPADWEEDLRGGLSVIHARSESLARFMEAYSRLARLPQPNLRQMAVGDWVNRVARLERRLEVTMRPGPDVEIRADPDQLDQVLINLVRNAVDAATADRDDATRAEVSVEWSVNGSNVLVRVTDNGPGLPESANLFVPFFTTKPGGSGIGLALSRQIVEAHEGTLTLENNPAPGTGVNAVLALPLSAGS